MKAPTKDMLKNIISILNFCLLTTSFFLVFFAIYLFTWAAEDKTPTDVEKTSQTEDLVCEAFMKSFMEQRRADFAKFMNQHFQSKKATSHLIPAAMEKFRIYRQEARAEAAKFMPKTGSTAEQAIKETPSCEEAVEKDFQIMKELIRQHIIANAYAKKATHLLDTYKRINGKLEKLNFSIGQMYGYFGALSQKLPCYASKCVKK